MACFRELEQGHGRSPTGLSLERIDNDGNYEKSNCRWATIQEQNDNHMNDRDPATGLYTGRVPSLWASEYRAWMSMRRRVTKGNKKMHPLYYDRGITVCSPWEASFEQFLADMGPIPHPGWTLDRENNDGNYEPGNCRWADNQTQAINRRQNQRRPPNREQAA